MKKKLVITGASGFLGYHLLHQASAQNFEIHALYQQHFPKFDKCVAHKIDLNNHLALGDLLDDIAPDFVIHAAALADANYCQKHPDESKKINVEATEILAGICSDFQIPMVFTSTDLVFDGHKGNYVESDAPNPLMLYGEHKVRAEESVLRIYPNALVARIPMLFGELQAAARSPFADFVTDLQQGKTANLFYDEYRSMCGAYSLAYGLLQMMRCATGILHVAGMERLSRYDFGIAVCKAFGTSERLINRVSQRDFAFAAPRPRDVSLNCARAISLGYQPKLVQEELALLARYNSS